MAPRYPIYDPFGLLSTSQPGFFRPKKVTEKYLALAKKSGSEIIGVQSERRKFSLTIFSNALILQIM